MPELISKVQHKTYEKGEFSEEKARNLDETITLIKNFPWDAERTLTDVQLTGPSVTIKDENLNYLKIGLYFNDKFCLYYLDNDNHLYEYHAPTMDDACRVVTDYFDGKLDLSTFEKHFFNIGNQAHFVTNYFEYRTKVWKAFVLTGFLILYFLIFVTGALGSSKNGLNGFTGFLVIFALFLGFILLRVYYFIYVHRNCYLQISKGNDVFKYGFDEDSIQTYNKADIQEIQVYETRGSRNPNFFILYEIIFKDGSSIKLSNILISDFDFRNKFSPDLINYAKKAFIWQLK